MCFTNSVAVIGFDRPEPVLFVVWTFQMHWIVPHKHEIAVPRGSNMFEFEMPPELICTMKSSVCFRSFEAASAACVVAGRMPLSI